MYLYVNSISSCLTNMYTLLLLFFGICITAVLFRDHSVGLSPLKVSQRTFVDWWCEILYWPDAFLVTQPVTSDLIALTILVLCAMQALSIDSRSVEALSVKGLALVEVKKMQEAVSHFREALRLAPYRFEAYNSMLTLPNSMNLSECSHSLDCD